MEIGECKWKIPMFRIGRTMFGVGGILVEKEPIPDPSRREGKIQAKATDLLIEYKKYNGKEYYNDANGFRAERTAEEI